MIATATTVGIQAEAQVVHAIDANRTAVEWARRGSKGDTLLRDSLALLQSSRDLLAMGDRDGAWRAAWAAIEAQAEAIRVLKGRRAMRGALGAYGQAVLYRYSLHLGNAVQTA